MFVSSYNTFVQPSSAQKVDKQRTEKLDLSSTNFSSKLSQQTSTDTVKSSFSSTVNQFNKKNLATKQEITNQNNKQYQPVKDALTKYSAQTSLVQAKGAYQSNAKMFSLAALPRTTLNQTKPLDSTLPKEPRNIKELNMRHKMVNTYLANENYYKVTA